MKAWIVSCDYRWTTLLHAETRGKAITKARRIDDGVDYIDFRARRIPGLDDLPITYKGALVAGFEYEHDEDSGITPEEAFVNDCWCEICSEKKNR